MNANQLADYLINNDCEMIIIKGDYQAVQEIARDEKLDVDLDTALEALEIAQADPYVQETTALLN